MTNEQQQQLENGNGVHQYQYSVKIEQSALGARVSVHSYSDVISATVSEAIFLYESTRNALMARGFKIAPEEPAKK